MSSNKLLPIIIAACLLLSSCAQPAAELPELITPKSENYNTAAVTRADISRSVNNSAKFYAPLSQKLYFPIESATLKEVYVKSYQFVEEGELIAEIMPTQSALDLEIMQINLQKARDNFDKGKLRYKEHLSDFDKQIAAAKANSGDTTELELSRTLVDIDYRQFIYNTEQSLADQQLTLEQAKEKAAATQLTAPFAGIIGAVTPIKQGKTIYGYDLVAEIVSGDKVLVEVNDGDAAAYRYGMSVGMEFKKEQFSGKVVSAPNVLPKAQHSPILLQIDREITLQEYTQQLQSKVNRYDLADALVVPRSAVYRADNTAFVYLLKDGSLRKRYVSPGLTGNEYTEILDGLEEGEIVVIK